MGQFAVGQLGDGAGGFDGQPAQRVRGAFRADGVVDFQLVDVAVNLGAGFGFDALQGFLQIDVEAQFVGFAAQVGGEAGDVAIGLLLQVGRGHYFPQQGHGLVLDVQVDAAEQVAGGAAQGIVDQHFVVDAVVGVGFVNGVGVGCRVGQPLGKVGQHQEVQQPGQDGEA